MTKRLGLLLKLVVSLSLLAYLFHKVGWGGVWAEIRAADPLMVVAYVLLGVLGTGLSAEKWRLLCRPHHIDARFRRLFSLYVVGYFFSQFLPTSVGGDVVRAYELGRQHDNHPGSIASVFMERYTGVSALIVFALAAILVDVRYLGDPRISVPIVSVFGGYVVFSWLVFHPATMQLLRRRFAAGLVGRVLEKAGRVQDAIHGYGGHWGALGAAMGYSIMFYVVTILNVYVGCRTFGIEVPISSLVVAVPVMLILFMMPISIGGVGLQEWAYFFVLSMVGVPSAVALSLGLMFRARTIAFALAGGALYPVVTGGRRPGDYGDAPRSA